jgi:hypothetical protein
LAAWIGGFGALLLICLLGKAPTFLGFNGVGRHYAAMDEAVSSRPRNRPPIWNDFAPCLVTNDRAPVVRKSVHILSDSPPYAIVAPGRTPVQGGAPPFTPGAPADFTFKASVKAAQT